MCSVVDDGSAHVAVLAPRFAVPDQAALLAVVWELVADSGHFGDSLSQRTSCLEIVKFLSRLYYLRERSLKNLKNVRHLSLCSTVAR